MQLKTLALVLLAGLAGVNTLRWTIQYLLTGTPSVFLNAVFAGCICAVAIWLAT